MTRVKLAVRWVAVFIAFSVVAGSGARAQLLQGTIDGNVADSSQAAVVGAKVTAKSQQTNFVREAVTNSSGAYDLPGLPPETYTITVTAPGFQNYVQTGVSVTPNTIRRVNATLAVGQVTETLTVEASAQALQAGPFRNPFRRERDHSDKYPGGRTKLSIGRRHASRRVAGAEWKFFCGEPQPVGEFFGERHAHQHQQHTHRRCGERRHY